MTRDDWITTWGAFGRRHPYGPLGTFVVVMGAFALVGVLGFVVS